VADRRDALRARLVYIQAELVEMLARNEIDGGMLALLGGVGAAVAAVDRMPDPKAAPATRAAVADDGQAIMLTLYDNTGHVAAAELDPLRTVALVGRLLEAALLRLRQTW
jgi:hypothetical protein